MISTYVEIKLYLQYCIISDIFHTDIHMLSNVSAAGLRTADRHTVGYEWSASAQHVILHC
jgi:hypothetical protein